MDIIKNRYAGKEPMGQAMHRKAMDFFRQYLIVGGMPQAVEEYLQSHDFNKVDQIKRDILTLYRGDITKHASGYEMKVAADQIMKEYRRIYKMQNARKQRNQQKRDIASSFDNWAAFAKQKLKACQNGEITLDEMKQQISGADWMP